jgi:hypothetical protein
MMSNTVRCGSTARNRKDLGLEPASQDMGSIIGTMSAGLASDQCPLDSLGQQIKTHWREHRPTMYREMVKAGKLDQAVYRAQERTRDAFAKLVSNQGVPPGQADEATRELWAFLPDEHDVPDVGFDPTAL